MNVLFSTCTTIFCKNRSFNAKLFPEKLLRFHVNIHSHIVWYRIADSQQWLSSLSCRLNCCNEVWIGNPYAAPEYLMGTSKREIWTFVYGSKTLGTLLELQALNDHGRAKNISFCSRTIWHIFFERMSTRTALLIFTVEKSSWIDTRKYDQVNASDSLFAFQQKKLELFKFERQNKWSWSVCILTFLRTCLFIGTYE